MLSLKWSVPCNGKGHRCFCRGNSSLVITSLNLAGLRQPFQNSGSASINRQSHNASNRCKLWAAATGQTGEDRTGNKAETEDTDEDPAYRAFLEYLAGGVDSEFGDLPLEHLRREGELGWGFDTEGPLGPEKVDNVYHKEQEQFNSTAILMVGMGSWRLAIFVSETLQAVVANIEGAWRHLVDDLGLYPMNRDYLYLDSLDPKKKHKDWSYLNIQPPERGEEGWPRLQIENRCYQSEEFRKLHLEVAHRQDGLEVVHCVMYPRAEYDLPILSLDLVAMNGVVSLGIIDPCPVSKDQSLPEPYAQMIRALQDRCKVTSNRAMPSWGKSIFSEHCVMMRPDNESLLRVFYQYAIALVRLHLRYAHTAKPIQQDKPSRLEEIEFAHKRYSEQHLKNSKTKRVLASAFDEDFAEDYMTKVMFDTA